MNGIETANLRDFALKVATNATYKCEQKLYQTLTHNYLRKRPCRPGTLPSEATRAPWGCTDMVTSAENFDNIGSSDTERRKFMTKGAYAGERTL